jgi:NAD(P)-dependent dehydrogenase (short-subunit alcohol dehydrogenase family)
MIILTGASGGIGKQLIGELKKIDEVIGTYFKNKPDVGEYYQLDVTNEESISNFVKAISSRLSKITLINLAGISIDKLTHNLLLVDWNKVLSVNLTGPFLMSRHLLPYMIKEKWGRIINVSSVVSQIGVPGTAAYAASKSGLIGLTKTLAKEYAPYGITVNCLCFGYFSLGLISTIPTNKVELLKEQIPLKKLGETKDISVAIEFLIKCDYITGTTINLNGGMF